MPEVETELDAENMIMAAVMGDVKPEDSQDLDAVEAKAVTSQPDADAEPEGEPAAASAEEPGEEFIEVPTEEGKDPLRVPLKDAIEAYQGRQAFEAQKEQAIEQVTGYARQQAVAMVTQSQQAAMQVSQHVQAVLQMLNPPQPPDDQMLDERSPSYNPDGYHRAFAIYQRNMNGYQQVQTRAQEMAQAAQAQGEWLDAQRRAEEDRVLIRYWPEIADEAVQETVWNELKTAYRMTDEDLGKALDNHKYALVARDALAYRKMMAKGPETRKQVEAKAPKLVRTKSEAKAGGAQSRNVNGQYASGALDNLRKTKSDDAAAAYFAGLAKAGRL